MALIGNYSVLNKTAGRTISGSTVSNTRADFNKSGANRNKMQSMARFNSVPNGTSVPYSWVIPQTSGGMAASTGRVTGVGTVTGSVAQGVGISSTLTGVGTISNANLNLIIALVAALSGTGTISSANLAAVQNLAAALSGTGTISSADMKLIVGLTSALSGVGSASASTAFIGLSYMTADITPFTSLSPEGLASSLLDNNDIETGYSLRESLRLVLSALAGKISGAEGTTITIRSADDSKSRIVATVDSNGNRTSITYDVSD